jgi:ABC-2 type transport system ATP-binding protein
VRHLRLSAGGVTAHDAVALLGAVPGVGQVEVLESDGSVTLSATLSGDIQPLVQALASLQLRDLVLEEPNLEESVLKMYSAPQEAAT